VVGVRKHRWLKGADHVSWADTRIEEATWVCVDVETTGLEVEDGHRVTEVATVRGGSTGPAEEFTTLVNPERPLDAKAAEVSGLTDEQLAQHEPFASVSRAALGHLSGAVIVAHNAPFDFGFLESEFLRTGVSLPPAPIVDTTIVAGEVLGLARRNLASVARALKLTDQPIHRALDDARATRGVLLRGLGKLIAEGAETVADVIDALTPPDPPNQPLIDNPFPPIREALRSGVDLKIQYAGARGSYERIIKPIRMEFKGPNLVLGSFCRSRKAPRSFRVDRIVSAEVVW